MCVLAFLSIIPHSQGGTVLCGRLDAPSSIGGSAIVVKVHRLDGFIHRKRYRTLGARFRRISPVDVEVAWGQRVSLFDPLAFLPAVPGSHVQPLV